MTPSQGLTPDKSGFLRYAIVILAPEKDQKAVDTVRRQLAIQIPLIPAHVTALGSFAAPRDLEALKLRLDAIARDTRLFTVHLIAVEYAVRGGLGSAWLRVQRTPEFQALHDKLWDAVRPMTMNVYGDDKGDRFMPHLTVYQEVDAGEHEKGIGLVKRLRLSREFTARELSLMGLIGERVAGRGRWETVSTFPLG